MYFENLHPEKKIRSNPPRKRISDLASLPKPNYDVFDHSIFRDGTGLVRGTHRIFTTRGCPAKCTFCDWGVFGQRVTFQNIPKIVEEMQRRVDQYGTTNFVIADDVFTVNKRHVDAFKGQGNRVLSLVGYLNEDWLEENGGELVIYNSSDDVEGTKVLPKKNTLVVFLSEQFPHEVLPATRTRHSIAGWFRVNGSVNDNIDPPH